MHSESNKIHLWFLGLTSLVLSRLMFFFFDDPEGPNLLIVAVAAVILYLFSLFIYSLLSFPNPKKLPLVIFFQVLVIAILGLSLR